MQPKNNDVPKDIKPPENYRQMIDTNITLTKIMLDIVNTYSGVASQQVGGEEDKTNKRRGKSNQKKGAHSS